MGDFKFITPEHYMAERYNKGERELAEQISNDISEDMPLNRYSKESLALAVRYYADLAYITDVNLTDAKLDLLLRKLNLA